MKWSDIMLTTYKDICSKVFIDYLNDDVELCGEFFDFEVSTTKHELLRAYAKIQETINGDTIVRLRDSTELMDIRDRGATTHVSGWKYEGEDESLSEVYTGNMKEFLESLEGREEETGWYRLSDYSERYHGFEGLCGGVKQCFVL